jgi:hypothetical protein
MARHGLSQFEEQWLRERMGHKWVSCGRVFNKCSACGVRRKRHSSVAHRHRREEMNYLTCPKAKRPNRWRMHFARAAARDDRSRVKQPELAARLMSELKLLEVIAKRLPQTMANWAYHPVARRYRRIVRKLWTLPISNTAAAESPTRSRMLTRAGDLKAGHTYGSDSYLDRMYAKRRKVEPNEWRSVNEFAPLPVEHVA